MLLYRTSKHQHTVLELRMASVTCLFLYTLNPPSICEMQRVILVVIHPLAHRDHYAPTRCMTRAANSRSRLSSTSRVGRGVGSPHLGFAVLHGSLQQRRQ